jgi:hypothetical protein
MVRWGRSPLLNYPVLFQSFSRLRLFVIPETLWLRLLGRDQVQQQAITELMTLPPSPIQRLALEQLANFQLNLRVKRRLNKTE